MPAASALVTSVLLAAFVAPPRGHAQEAAFAGLGHLPGGAVSWANDVSADGSTVVGASRSTRSGSDMEAFVWTAATGMVGLGDLDGDPVSSRAQSISADGSVVVGLTGSGDPFRWTQAGGMVALEDPLGVLVGGQAFGVSADGSVIVGVAQSPENQAFRWTQATGMVGLGWLPSSVLDSFLFDVAADGDAACGISFDGDDFGVAPILWTPRRGMTSLGDVPGGEFYAIAWGISADGTTLVGDARLPNGGPSTDEAFVWTAEGGFVFPDPTHGATFGSTAQAASADGSIVVGATSGGAMLWDAQHGLRLLRDVLTGEFGLDLDGWTLGTARSVSSKGNIIVGSGTDPAGNTQAWIARLPPLPAGTTPVRVHWDKP